MCYIYLLRIGALCFNVIRVRYESCVPPSKFGHFRSGKMAEMKHSRVLFTAEDGSDLKFYMVPCEERKNLKPLIEVCDCQFHRFVFY